MFFLKGSILWVIFEKKRKKFNSLSRIKRSSILRIVVFQKEGSINWVMFRRRFNSLSPVKKKFILWVTLKKCSILWVVFKKKGAKSLSHIFEGHIVQKRLKSLSYEKKGSILWVKEKEGSILWVMLQKKVQFFESCCKRRFNSLSHVAKEGSILWVIWEGSNKSVEFLEWVIFLKKVQFLESL